MIKWREVLVRAEDPISETIQKLESGGMQAAFVVNETNALVGIVTDGDLRRAFLKGVSLTDRTKTIMNASPLAIEDWRDARYALNFMRDHLIHHVPVIDRDQQLINVFFIDELVGLIKKPNAVLIMAGGLGTRLRPLTNERPKPMLEINGKPILERIIEKFVLQGFTDIFLSVNYMSEKIENYFQNGEKWGANIKYVHERERMGTAGSISLLAPFLNSEPFIVMNGDVLADVDFNDLIQQKLRTNSLACIAVKEYSYQIPYGVVTIEKELATSIVEKPSQRYCINAGIYVFDQNIFKKIPDREIDMPELLNDAIKNERVSCYLLQNNWNDIGRIEDLNAAQEIYKN